MWQDGGAGAGVNSSAWALPRLSLLLHPESLGALPRLSLLLHPEGLGAAAGRMSGLVYLQPHRLRPRAGGEMETWNVGWRGTAGVLVARDTAATPEAVQTWLRWSGTGYKRLSSVRVVAGEAGRVYASAIAGDMQRQVAQAPCRVLLVAPGDAFQSRLMRAPPRDFVEPHRELRCQKRLINGRRAYRSSPPIGDSSPVTLLWFNNITGSWVLSSQLAFLGLQWMSDDIHGPWHGGWEHGYLTAYGDASVSPTLVGLWTGLGTSRPQDETEQSSWYVTAGLRFVSGDEMARAKHREATFTRLQISTCESGTRGYSYGLFPMISGGGLAVWNYSTDCGPSKQSVPDAVVRRIGALEIFGAFAFSVIWLFGVVVLGGVTAELCKKYCRCPPFATGILAAIVNVTFTAAAFRPSLTAAAFGTARFNVELAMVLVSALVGSFVAFAIADTAAANAPPPQNGVPQPPAPQIFWPPNLHVESIPPLAPVPPTFVCPITMAPMANPAITPRGTSYDRAALCDWIIKQHRYPGGEARVQPPHT